MLSSLRTLISAVTGLAVAAQTTLPAQAAFELSRASYEACQAQNEQGLRDAIAQVSAEALKASTRSVDYRALVNEQWRRNNLDQIIDARVDIAVADVKNETSWSERLQSLTSQETSQKLATAVAERVYHSDAVKLAIEDLATGVAREVGKTIEFASTDQAGPLLDCLKAFVGPRYGTAVSQALAGDAGKSIAVDPGQGAGDVTAGSVLKQSSGGLTGITLVVMRRQLANLATRIGQRMVGSVLSRLVSVVAGGVGLVLIAKDIWEFRNGVLPIIATEMKATATKDKVREEIANSLTEQINEHVKGMATATADNVLEVWQSFKRAHAMTLRLAEANGAFRGFLDSAKPEALPRLDEVVGLIASSEGEAAVIRRLDDGTLNTAVHMMPDKGMMIARDTKSVGEALAWMTLAGGDLARVADLELHRKAQAQDFSRAGLDRLLALPDRTAITRLAAVPAKPRDVLLALPGQDLMTLAKALSETELATLAGYLDGLQDKPRALVLAALAENPGKMQALAAPRVREGIIASADQGAAAQMMLRPGSSSLRQIGEDAVAGWEGRIDPILLWYRHPWAVGAAAFIALILLTWFLRLFRRRPAPPNAAAGPPEAPAR